MGLIVLLSSSQDNLTWAHSRASQQGHLTAKKTNPGYLNGDWTLISVAAHPESEGRVDENDQKKDPSNDWFEHTLTHRLKSGIFEISFHIQNDEGVFKIAIHHPERGPRCEVTVKYEVAYCCPKMQKLFLSRADDSLEVSSKGCIENQLGFGEEKFSTFIDRWIEADYHFLFSDLEKKHMTLDGPYQQSLHRLKWVRQ